MPKLVLSMDGLVLKEIPLVKERVTIGRKAHNDIQIDNLAISGEHAVIVSILDDAFLEDLNSTNGTYVNGQAVKKHALQDMDVIELGKYRIKYIQESVLSQTNSKMMGDKMFSMTDDFTRTNPGSGRSSDTTLGFEVETTGGDSTPFIRGFGGGAPQTGPVGVVRILSGRNVGRELELSKSLTTLGKPGSQVAVITRRPHGYFLTHVEGDTFPILNGKQLDAQAHLLGDHDVIEIAGVKMEFYLRGSDKT